jgi:hypothetical protein
LVKALGLDVDGGGGGRGTVTTGLDDVIEEEREAVCLVDTKLLSVKEARRRGSTGGGAGMVVDGRLAVDD